MLLTDQGNESFFLPTILNDMAEDTYLEKAIQWTQSKGFFEIKAQLEGFEAPTAFTRKDGEEPIIPDITAVKTGGKCYVEVATKSDDVQKKISKWMLLSTMASMKGGKLFLLAPRGHKSFTEDIVKGHNISAEVISI
jgi:hypothetical protein